MYFKLFTHRVRRDRAIWITSFMPLGMNRQLTWHFAKQQTHLSGRGKLSPLGQFSPLELLNQGENI